MAKSNRINFQVRMDKSLKILAEQKAEEYGFSSAQDMTKYLLKAVVDERVSLGILGKRSEGVDAYVRLLPSFDY